MVDRAAGGQLEVVIWRLVQCYYSEFLATFVRIIECFLSNAGYSNTNIQIHTVFGYSKNYRTIFKYLIGPSGVCALPLGIAGE